MAWHPILGAPGVDFRFPITLCKMDDGKHHPSDTLHQFNLLLVLLVTANEMHQRCCVCVYIIEIDRNLVLFSTTVKEEELKGAVTGGFIQS